MGEAVKSKRIIITIDDWCNEDFTHVDIFHMKKWVEDMLEDYDVEVKSVIIEEVKDKNETRSA